MKNEKIEKLKKLNILGSLRQHLGATNEDDTSFDDLIADMDAYELTERWCALELGYVGWWNKMKYIYDSLSTKEEDKENVPDVSFMWHCSEEKSNIIDYEKMDINPSVALIANKAAQYGFRHALRKLEQLGIIKMDDIDRSLKIDDQLMWDNMLNNQD